MISDKVGYYEIFGLNRQTYNYDIWLGSGTAAAAAEIKAKVGGFLGYGKITADGWACKANR